MTSPRRPRPTTVESGTFSEPCLIVERDGFYLESFDPDTNTISVTEDFSKAARLSATAAHALHEYWWRSRVIDGS